jgi:hypothetical protein
VFDGVPSGEYAIQVRADDHLGASANVDVPTAALTLDTIIVDVNLTPTGTFSGFATLENGVSHENIVVYAEGTSYVAVTDPTGAYAITDVPVGGYNIRATKSHYIDDTESGTLTFAGQNFGLPSMLLRLDNNISPVATITIPVQPMIAGSPITFTSSGTDADGSVVLYEWDWENDGIIDSGSGLPGNTSTPTRHRKPTVKLRVTDNQGAIGLDAENLVIGEAAIHMALTGVDTNPGTSGAPVLTLVKAYQLAVLNTSTTVKAQAGTYTQVPAFLDGINVEGGYSSTWVANFGYTTFTVGTSRATANAITTATTISRVEIQTTNAAPGPSPLCIRAAARRPVFNNCIFRASTLERTTGSAGSDGERGGIGYDRAGDGAGLGAVVWAALLGVPSTRAAAADRRRALGRAREDAAVASSVTAALLATRVSGDRMAAREPMEPPAPPAPRALGSIVGTDWVPADGGAGTSGTNGLGGGGGGGGGGQTCTFCTSGPGNGGGGGGGGATGGGAGSAGLSGFGSIAVLLNNSSPTFQGCQFFTLGGTGGRIGGYGGNAAAGGAGGLGGSTCTGEVGKGGNGGNGGSGGGGGAGAGGAGGPSVGIMRANGSTPATSGNSYTIGVPGGGGTGGVRGDGGAAAPSGVTGITGPTIVI